jgi:hypothetical protein
LDTEQTKHIPVSMLSLKRQQMDLYLRLHPIKAAITTDTAMVMATDPAGQDNPSYFFLLLINFLF